MRAVNACIQKNESNMGAFYEKNIFLNFDSYGITAKFEKCKISLFLIFFLKNGLAS